VNRKRLRHHGCKGRRNPVQTVPLGRTRKLRTLANTALCCQRIIQPNSGNLKKKKKSEQLPTPTSNHTQCNLPITERKGTEIVPVAGRFLFRQTLQIWIICSPGRLYSKGFPIVSSVSFKTGFAVSGYVHC